jgi:hypothetical protein
LLFARKGPLLIKLQSFRLNITHQLIMHRLAATPADAKKTADRILGNAYKSCASLEATATVKMLDNGKCSVPISVGSI